MGCIMALHIENEADRCLNCKHPMCQQNCPVHTPIPHIIQLFKEHKLQEAGAELFENNPISVVCATVCNYEKQCAGHCVLGRKVLRLRKRIKESPLSEAGLLE